jgi:hypothetical protein
MIKQLKNRYNDPGLNKKFVIGIDRSRMKLYDVEDSAQTIVDSGQVQNVVTNKNDDKRNKFKDFKV